MTDTQPKTQGAVLTPSVIFEQLSHGNIVHVLGYAFVPESGSSRMWVVNDYGQDSLFLDITFDKVKTTVEALIAGHHFGLRSE